MTTGVGRLALCAVVACLACAPLGLGVDAALIATIVLFVAATAAQRRQ